MRNLSTFPFSIFRNRAKTLLFASLAFLLVDPALRAADYYPPRISQVDGSAAYIPAGSVDWEELTINMPVLDGDRVYAHADSRLEIELGDANFLRLADGTDLTFGRVLEKEMQLRLDEGVLILRLNKSRRIRLQTPLAAVEVKKKGLYRIGMDGSGQMQVIVRKGRAEIESAGGTQNLNDGEEVVLGARYQGPMQVGQYSYQDEFDRWSDRRDADYMSSRSVAYVGGLYYPGVYDLDRYGYWTSYPGCGRVWVPSVSFGWTPYRSGFWFNLGFGFGWTWISYEPWGWLPYHYGSWYYYGPHARWCWIPGGFHRWYPHRVNFYHGGGYVGWAPAPHRFVNNNSVTVINNNTIINRPAREGLTVIREGDFGVRRGPSDRALSAPREVVNSFSPGLPDNLPWTRGDGVRRADAGRSQMAKQAAVPAPSNPRASARTPATSTPALSTATTDRNMGTRADSFAPSRAGSTRTETGTSRVLRAESGSSSTASRPPTVIRIPSRNTRRSTTPTPAARSGSEIKPQSRAMEAPAFSETKRQRSVQRISRPEIPASVRTNQGSGASIGRSTQSQQSPVRGYTYRPRSSSRERSSSRPSISIPSFGRSATPSITRNPGSIRAPSSASPSRSYSRPSAPARSGGSSGRSSAPSRNRSSGRSGRN